MGVLIEEMKARNLTQDYAIKSVYPARLPQEGYPHLNTDT